MRFIALLLGFFCVIGSALRFQNFPNVFVPGIFGGGNLSSLNNVYSPTYLWLTQAYYSDSSVYGGNFSYLLTPDIYGCDPNLSPSVYQGAIVSHIAGGNQHCGYGEASMYARTGLAAAVLVSIPIPQIYTTVHPTQTVPPNRYPPVVLWENLNPEKSMNFNIALSMVALKAAVKGFNVTLQLDFPEQSPIFIQFNTIPSGISFIYWFGLTLALVAVTLTACKFAMLWTAGFVRSIGAVTMAVCYFGSIWTVWDGWGAIAGFSPGMPLDKNVFAFFEIWPFTCAASALILAGFYFTEVALLTKQQAIAGLDKMRIPGIIAIGVVWIVCIVVSSLVPAYRTNDVPPPPNGSQGVVVAVIYGIMGGFTLVIVVWGSVALMHAIGERKAIIIPFIGLLFFALMNYCWSLGLWIQVRFFVDRVTLWNQGQVAMIFMAAEVWGNAITFIALSFLFRVSVSKEIEISKSATSSTSSVSSMSSKSTSSSASHQEPVIEL